VTAAASPALQAFIAQLGDELVLAQVLIRRLPRGYELRHETDRRRAETELRQVPPDGLRALAQSTDRGAFRPLKSAPNLQSGWQATPGDDAELGAALEQLYPGAVADWFAAHRQQPPVTGYREFTARQTGMYRITTMLTDEQATQAIRACCHRRFCLKQRLWAVDGLNPDDAQEKSLIPCLEPCALMLEFARLAARLEQDEKARVETFSGDIQSLEAALESTLREPKPGTREADFNLPDNPRRLQLALEKARSGLQPTR